eukprot:208533-Prymnesium_polylepis.2
MARDRLRRAAKEQKAGIAPPPAQAGRVGGAHGHIRDARRPYEGCQKGGIAPPPAQAGGIRGAHGHDDAEEAQLCLQLGTALAAAKGDKRLEAQVRHPPYAPSPHPCPGAPPSLRALPTPLPRCGTLPTRPPHHTLPPPDPSFRLHLTPPFAAT